MKLRARKMAWPAKLGRAGTVIKNVGAAMQNAAMQNAEPRISVQPRCKPAASLDRSPKASTRSPTQTIFDITTNRQALYYYRTPPTQR